MYVERKGVWNLTKSKGSVAVSVKIKKTCMVHFLLTIIIVCQGKPRSKKVKKKGERTQGRPPQEDGTVNQGNGCKRCLHFRARKASLSLSVLQTAILAPWQYTVVAAEVVGVDGRPARAVAGGGVGIRFRTGGSWSF
jgi:hypothetical protein